MTTTLTASDRIVEEVTSWPGVEAGPGRRGELAFRVGRREIGHLHGDRAAHFSFPKDVWAGLFAEGRVTHHPVFPGREGPAARAIRGEDDVREVIELMRLNYDRAVARHGVPGAASPIDGLHALGPQPLPFDTSLEIRAFLLRRDAGNVLLYGARGLDAEADAIEELGGLARRYLGHSHEAGFLDDSLAAPLFVHEAERGSVERHHAVRGTFSRRHVLDDDLQVIPIPGHTPGSTAYLWHTGELRVLFTADTIYFRDGEWVAAVLRSSDREAYVESLELIRGLDFDVVVPWAATAGQPYHAVTDRADAQRRIDAILERVRRGEGG